MITTLKAEVENLNMEKIDILDEKERVERSNNEQVLWSAQFPLF